MDKEKYDKWRAKISKTQTKRWAKRKMPDLFSQKGRIAFVIKYIPVALSYILSVFWITFVLIFLFRVPLDWVITAKIVASVIFVTSALIPNAKIPIKLYRDGDL